MNRKQRNLKYIREKNNLRKFGLINCILDVNSSLAYDVEYLEQMISFQIEEISNYFKLDLFLKDFTTGYVNEGFMNGILTCKLSLSRKR